MLRVGVITVVLVLGGSALSVGAPTPPVSTGFSDPGYISPVEEFRLPAWGYRNIKLDIRFDAEGHTAEASATTEFSAGEIVLSPAFEHYRESEESVSSLYLRLDGRWHTNRYAQDASDKWWESKTRRLGILADVEAEGKLYFRPGHFLTITGDGWAQHQVIHDEDRRSDRDAEVTDRTYNTYDANLGIGFGFGRVRNVTPVIRAMRVAERLKALGKVSRLSDDTIRKVAEHFSARSGYSKVHDRGNKHFWSDLMASVPGIDGLTAFEVYYISEVINEAIGTRLQGWEASAGVSLTGTQQSAEDEYGLFSGFVAGKWYRNHTLDHQTGLTIRAMLGKPIDGSSERGPEGSVRIGADHLWVIADRLTWKPYLSAQVTFREIDETQDRDSWLKTFQAYSLGSAFTFFVEDSIALTSTGSFYVSRRDTESYPSDRYIIHETGWRVRLSLTYYFDRAFSF
jgi:hypothetical protein